MSYNREKAPSTNLNASSEFANWPAGELIIGVGQELELEAAPEHAHACIAASHRSSIVHESLASASDPSSVTSSSKN